MLPLILVLSTQNAALELDLSQDSARQVIVDQEDGQYLGHVSTVLLEDGRTMLAVYPKGHGRGAIILKKSTDGGLTWSERLPVPWNWSTSLETPTIHRTFDPRTGKKRLILWSGLYPARLSTSEDDGATWTPLQPVGNWGGIVVMGDVKRLKDGRYVALFHDDGRFFKPNGRVIPTMTLFKTLSKDGGLTWSRPEAIHASSEIHLCEPGLIRSPNGKEFAMLLRENRRVKPSHVMFTANEAQTWSAPIPMHADLSGDRHTLRYAPDGRLVCVMRDMREGPTKGDFIAWVGRYEDLKAGRPGQYRVRLLDNQDSWDCGYPGLELLPDATFVATTYGTWTKGEQPYIKSIRFRIEDFDRLALSHHGSRSGSR